MGRRKQIALGIPSATKSSPPAVSTPIKTVYGRQLHRAEKAGFHTDLRVINPKDDDRMALSWAVRHWPAPGERRLAVQQPDHMPEYVGWEGTIPSGYGAGEVELKEYGVAQVLSSGKDKLTVATFPQGKEEVYTLIRMKGDDWLIMNRTEKMESKPEYRKSADITTRGRERLKTYPAVMGPTIAAGLGYGMGRKKDVISPLSAGIIRRKIRSRMPSIRLQRWARKHLTTKRIMSAAKWAPLAASIPVSAAIAEIVALRRSGKMPKSAEYLITEEYIAGYEDAVNKRWR